jgi:hypothetical protein
MTVPSRSRTPRRAGAALAALFLAAAAGCVSPDARDREAMERDALLINLWQEVHAYYEAANRNDAERVRQIKGRVQPKIDAHLDVIMDILRRGENDDERMMAACILGLSSSRKVVPPLVEALDSPRDGIRHHACLSLGTFGYPGTPAEPVVALLDDPSSVVRRDAAWVLSRILRRGQGSLYLSEEDVQDWPGLCNRMAQESGGEKPAPGRRLMETFTPKVQDLVLRAGSKGTFEETRRLELLRALNGALRTRDLHRGKDFDGLDLPDATKVLLGRPRSGLSGREVAQLNRALLAAAYPAHISLGEGQARGWALDALQEALDDEDTLVRCEAAIALGRIGSTESVDPLIRKGLSDPDWRVRMNAASALGLTRDRRALDALIRMLPDTASDPPVHGAVKFALREISGQDFGGSHTNWKTWWDEQQAPPPKEPEPKKPEDGAPDAKAEGKAPPPASAPAGASPPPPAKQ